MTSNPSDREASRRPAPADERGQAMVEFALISPLFILLVVGIIQFGVALNFWLDMQRIANQGARWAVVNSWPGCPRTEPVPLTGTACRGTNALDSYLETQALSSGLRSSVDATICYPDDGDSMTTAGQRGTPVRVRLEAPFDLVPILGAVQLTLGADATMRLEQTPTHITAAGC